MLTVTRRGAQNASRSGRCQATPLRCVSMGRTLTEGGSSLTCCRETLQVGSTPDLSCIARQVTHAALCAAVARPPPRVQTRRRSGRRALPIRKGQLFASCDVLPGKHRHVRHHAARSPDDHGVQVASAAAVVEEASYVPSACGVDGKNDRCTSRRKKLPYSLCGHSTARSRLVLKSTRWLCDTTPCLECRTSRACPTPCASYCWRRLAASSLDRSSPAYCTWQQYVSAVFECRHSASQ